MENINIWDTRLKDKFHYTSDIESIIDYIVKNKSTYFYVIDEDGLDNGDATTMYVSAINESAEKNGKKVVYLDSNHQAFINPFNDIFFSREFYNKYKDKINEAIINNLFNNNYVYINKYIYSDDLVKNLVLTAESINFQKGVTVPDDVVKILRANHISSYSYTDGEREELSTSQILGQPYKSVMSDATTINIDPLITDLENLKFISPNKEVYISMYDDKKNTLDAFNNVYEIINTLRKNGQNNRVVIGINNKRPFLDSKLYNSDLKYDVTGYDMSERSLENIKDENNILDLMVQDIKASSFSPFEKYLACYNITKKFKEYKENEEDRSDPRDMFKLLNNEYMVCVGYAKLLHELLYRVGIESHEWSIGVDTSYDAGFSMEEKTTENAGHARLIVSLDDPKYNLHGFYAADPTWDNDLQEDLYNHALMSFDKTCMEHRLLSLTDEDLIINVKDENDFYEKINALINGRMRREYLQDKSYDERYKLTIHAVASIMLDLLKDLKPEEYNKYKNEYSDISRTSDVNFDKKLIVKMGTVFLDNYAQDVSLDTIIDAAASVNKEVFSFNDEEAKEYRDYLYSKNLKIDKKAFPLYYENKSKIA